MAKQKSKAEIMKIYAEFRSNTKITFQQQLKKYCGKKIGSGMYRAVYELKQNPNYVIKVERNPGSFINIQEWLNWINYREYFRLKDWLAPCILINETGTLLVQKRVEHNRLRKDYPKKVPYEFTDLKPVNFGWIGDKFVCCDYAGMRTFGPPKGHSGMRYAKWIGSLKEGKP